MKEPVYTWDGVIATCTIIDDQGRKFIGEAYVHETDMDFASEKTGCTIAGYRASIQYLKSVKRDILKPQLAALKQLYYSMNRSKYYDKKSYANKMLWNQIRIKEEDLITVSAEIEKYKQALKIYINDKEEFYQATRKRRAMVAKDENN